MTRKAKQLLRLAAAIHAQWRAQPSRTAKVAMPEATWKQSKLLLRRIRRARGRGWHLAATRLLDELQESLQRLRDELTAVNLACIQAARSFQASVIDVHADLVALHDEFDKVSFSRRDRTISVTTEPIELDGVYLGPFEIRLNWVGQAEGRSHRYQVIALDPNPATANDSVTHPHVQDESACEGDGRQPIRNALEHGRLLDFFMLVATLLRTYNSGSPFVSLSDWYGMACADCETVVSGDERWVCEKCEATLCGECHYTCPICDGIFCSQCVTLCEGCDKSHCSDCMKPCDRCKTEFCQGCLDNNERCSKCHDQEAKEESEQCHALGDQEGHAVAPVHANCVGETAVPA